MAKIITDAIMEHCKKWFFVHVYEHTENFLLIYNIKGYGSSFVDNLYRTMIHIERTTNHKVRTFSYSYNYHHSEGEAIVIFD